MLIAIFCMPLLFSMINNPIGVKNIYLNQVNIFSDPGHINAINSFQGESRKAGFSFLAKVSENKYVYYSKFIIRKFLRQFSISNFFTPQEKMLGFSFSSPIFFGFLMPFLFGLFISFKSSTLRKYLAVSLILLLPSFLSKNLVNLNRLVLFEPVIIFIICFGLDELIRNKKRLLIILMIVLLMVQMIITIQDISFREYPRYERFSGTKFEIIEQ